MNNTIIHRIRQNHALEHATVHTLSRRLPGIQLVGRSDWTGFWLYGDVATELVRDAVSHGMDLMLGGDEQSAVHPRCGTNLSTGILLAGAAGMLTARTTKRSRWLGAIAGLAGIVSAIKLARPLGLWIQRNVTTTTDVASLGICGIERIVQGDLVIHHVVTGDRT